MDLCHLVTGLKIWRRPCVTVNGNWVIFKGIVNTALLYLFTACYFKVIIFWNVTPCSLLQRCQYFGEKGRRQQIPLAASSSKYEKIP
jgi:hypothetical protein